MEPLVVIAVVAIWLGLRLFAGRRVAAGQGRFIWVFFGPTFLVLLIAIWFAVRIWATQPLAAVGIALLSVPSAFLLARALRRMAFDIGAPAKTGELPPPMFDYIVWTAIGAPFVLVVLLLLLLVTGGLGATR